MGLRIHKCRQSFSVSSFLGYKKVERFWKTKGWGDFLIVAVFQELRAEVKSHYQWLPGFRGEGGRREAEEKDGKGAQGNLWCDGYFHYID